jgi:hypothetical protein
MGESRLIQVQKGIVEPKTASNVLPLLYRVPVLVCDCVFWACGGARGIYVLVRLAGIYTNLVSATMDQNHTTYAPKS